MGVVNPSHLRAQTLTLCSCEHACKSSNTMLTRPKALGHFRFWSQLNNGSHFLSVYFFSIDPPNSFDGSTNSPGYSVICKNPWLFKFLADSQFPSNLPSFPLELPSFPLSLYWTNSVFTVISYALASHSRTLSITAQRTTCRSLVLVQKAKCQPSRCRPSFQSQKASSMVPLNSWLRQKHLGKMTTSNSALTKKVLVCLTQNSSLRTPTYANSSTIDIRLTEI